MMRVVPLGENCSEATLPLPGGKSKVSCLIYFQSPSPITLILFYPANATL